MNAIMRDSKPNLLPLVGFGVGIGLVLLNSGRRVSAQERRIALTLYDEVWTEVLHRFYNVERLRGWDAWRYRFDARIHSIPDAVYYANRMLKSLDDRYTWLRNPRETRVEISHLDDRIAFPSLVADGVGYIDFTSFQAGSTGDQLRDALRDLGDCNRIILDMRGNGGGLTEECIACCSLFMEQGLVMTSRERLPDGSFQIRTVTIVPEGIESRYSRDGEPDRVELLPRYRPIAAGKQIVALMDDDTASASEMMLGCLADHGLVILIGKPTRGKGIGQDHLGLTGGVRLSITSMRYLLPSGHWLGDAGMTVRRGLIPHVPLQFTDNRSCMRAAMGIFFPSPGRKVA